MPRLLAITALIIGALFSLWRTAGTVPPDAAVPIAELRSAAARGTVPTLFAPLPDWLPLPATGIVATAGVYPAQPPYGAAASIILRIEESAEDFAGTYEMRLRAAGFATRRVIPPFDVTFASELALDAYQPETGRYVICILRRTHAAVFAQITFWEPPAPRL